MVIQVLTHAAVALVAGLVGYIVGFEVCAKRGHVRPVERHLDSGVVLYCLVGLALLLAGFSTYQGQAQDRARVACFNSYANAAADALDARQKPTLERDAAITHVFQVTESLIHNKATQAQFRAALHQYLVADARLTRERVKSPYPEPPREVCK